MAGLINPLSSCNDIIHCVMEWRKLEENVDAMTVCTSWRVIAADVAKKQLCIRAEEDLNLKMGNFLAMAGGTAMDYCPALKKLKDGCASKSISEIRSQLGGLTEKHSVVLDKGHVVGEERLEKAKDIFDSIVATAHFVGLTEEQHAAQMEAMKTTREGLGLKAQEAFVGLFMRKEHWVKGPQWSSEEVLFFPIRLFNLKMEGRKIIGDHPQGSYCISLKGRLIEFFVDPRPAGLYDRQRVGPFNPKGREALIWRAANPSAYFDPKSDALAK